MSHIFLSYSRTDAAIMRRVRDDLRAAGIAVWTDENLTPGAKSWRNAIENAIENAVGLVILMSPESKRSEWVEKEIGYATACKVQIFPVLVRGEERESVPLELINMQWVDARSNPHAAAGRLTPSLRQLPGLDAPPPPRAAPATRPPEPKPRAAQTVAPPPKAAEPKAEPKPRVSTRAAAPGEALSLNQLYECFDFTSADLTANRRGKMTPRQMELLRKEQSFGLAYFFLLIEVVLIALMIQGALRTPLGAVVTIGYSVFALMPLYIMADATLNNNINTYTGPAVIKGDGLARRVVIQKAELIPWQDVRAKTPSSLPGTYRIYARREAPSVVLSVEPLDKNVS